ncbi:general transcription factor 3C polypeptide 6 [Chanos chanos]|uniref:General transcription factor 3C polypeptide 6 n=1 Tax=Chanos chanos TaxID=29144 RepID=A0A6J2W6R4_CHACN|nr:general transcription factor 3C polypeptide 6 [Chanos chanos]
MEDEWEEEEQLVVVELSGIINPEFLTNSKETCKIVGIDTNQPILQVGPAVFAGEYEDALGTCVIFEETAKDKKDADACPSLKYKCHTSKKLMMQRTFLSERKEGEPSTGGIEILALNEQEGYGRSRVVCKYTDDKKKEKDFDPKDSECLVGSDESDGDASAM